MKEGVMTDSQRLLHVADTLVNFEHRVWVKAQEKGLTKKNLQVTAEILHKAQSRAVSKARDLDIQGNS